MTLNSISTVTKENIWHFTCAFCSGTWSVAVMDEWMPGELYCTHCGQQQINQEIITEKSKSASYGPRTGPRAGPPDASEEAIEPSISDMESTITIVEKKTPERLYAEDRMTHKVCKDGGWWNPITKECQGEGQGHNIVDNPDEV